jgi:predicted AlkP superfamily phosphohydrolase/phosphomutase
VLALTAILRYSFGRRGSRPAAVLLVVTVLASVAAPIWLRGPGEAMVRPPRALFAPTRISGAPRVRVFAFDGASLGFIRRRIAAGNLPNFGRLLSRGATMDLATLRPTQVEPVWVAAATGKFAQKTGVRSTAIDRVSEADEDVVEVLPDYCFAYALIEQAFVRAVDRRASSLTARPVWDILADYGIPSGTAGWPLTYPARATLGYVVSDRFDEAASSPLRSADAEAGDPTTAVDVARETFDRWQSRTWYDVLAHSSPDEVEPAGLSRVRWDRAYSDTAVELEQQFAPRLTIVRHEGLDALGHNYLRDAQPELFGDPRRTAPRRSVLDRYYAYIDAMLGAVAKQQAPGDLLLVVSGFGMEPTPLSKRLLARLLGNAELSGTHETAPDGFLIAYGTNVAGGEVPRGSIVDLAPTLLYYMGVPVGRDMDGFARTDLFTPTFAFEHPVKYVGSHEK